MDITQQTLQQLTQVEKQLKQCEQKLERIGRARVPVYFSVPKTARDGFTAIYNALETMKDILEQKPPRLEG